MLINEPNQLSTSQTVIWRTY